jgi:hypothetical protein
MKTIKVCCVLFIIFLFASCSITSDKFNIPEELSGKWKSVKNKLTVRTEPKWMKFNFISDTINVEITINTDKSAKGKIGNSFFENGKVFKNNGDPQKTKVAYIIKCKTYGNYFEKDPLTSKTVEIWLAPINEQNIMEAELRYTENGTKFPMADLKFMKLKTEN